jgi:hypothetical protein
MLIIRASSQFAAGSTPGFGRPVFLLRPLRGKFTRLKNAAGLLLQAFQEALEMRLAAHRSFHPMIED